MVIFSIWPDIRLFSISGRISGKSYPVSGRTPDIKKGPIIRPGIRCIPIKFHYCTKETNARRICWINYCTYTGSTGMEGEMVGKSLGLVKRMHHLARILIPHFYSLSTPNHHNSLFANRWECPIDPNWNLLLRTIADIKGIVSRKTCIDWEHWC
jgi:hypothetical protein